MTTRRNPTGACKAAGFLLVVAGLCTAIARSGRAAPLGRAAQNQAIPQAQLTPQSVPEIDPGSVLSAFTMLVGGLMVVTDRRRLF